MRPSFWALLLACAPASAQVQPGLTLSPAPATAVSTAAAGAMFGGTPVSMDRGPWVIGEVLLLSSGRPASDASWRDRVRASRGALYTPPDIASDAQALKGLGVFDSVEPALYEMTGAPVPPEYAGVAVSTTQVRLVFQLVEKGKAPPPQAGPGAKRGLPPVPLSGVVLTPTAYRGAGKHTSPGLGLDINATYFIGRLYGKNSFDLSPRKTNYIDRVGVWLLTADGKMQLQSEAAWRPAVAVGGEGVFLFRDSGQPKVDEQNPTLTVNASQKSTRILGDYYAVVSKKVGPLRSSVGIKQGNAGELVGQLSEFLTPDALRVFAGKPNARAISRTTPFASLMLLPKPQYPLAVEVMKFNGAPLKPVLINFKIGYFLKLNFDIAVLKYQGGYDVLGLLQFRYNHFPRR